MFATTRLHWHCCNVFNAWRYLEQFTPHSTQNRTYVWAFSPVTIRQHEILITLNIGFECIRGMEQGSLLGVKERVVSEKVVGVWRTGSSVRRRADRNLKRKCGPPPPPLQGERRERMGWGEGGRE